MTAEDAVDAVVLRLRAAGCVFAEDEAALLAAETTDASGRIDSTRLEAWVQRRVAGEPLEVIVGWAEFMQLRLAVAPGVFVPRRRTEALARQAIAAAESGSSPVVVDLCCGVGAVAAAVEAALPDAEVWASDLDPDAIACARRNLRHPDRVRIGDLFAALPPALRGCIDVLTANAPYVPTEAIAMMPPEARDFEHRIALDGGADGLDLHRRIAREAPEWLAPGGTLLIESSQRQAASTAEAMWAAGLDARVEFDDEVDGTVVIGRQPGVS